MAQLLPSASSTFDFATPTRSLVVRSASGTGFNFTQQDIDVHAAERASIPATFAIASIFPALAIMFVILRFVAASKSKVGRTADDWVILAALVPTVASSVWMICTYTIDKTRIMKSFFAEAEKGNFTELDDPLGNANALQWGPGVVSTFCLTALALIKVSILLLYRRLFPTPTMLRIVQAGIIFIIAIWITFVVPSLLGLANAHGVSNGIVFIFVLTFACVNLVTDVALLVLPMPLLWKLKLSTARKLQIVGIFSLGAFCVISSSVRLAYLAQYWQMLNFIFAHEKNWYATFTLAAFAQRWWMTWIWALIEPCTSIIAACLPTLKPLVDGLGDKNPWIGKALSVLSPRSLSSRSTKSEVSGDSTELSKVNNSQQRKVEVSENQVKLSQQRMDDIAHIGARSNWSLFRTDLSPVRTGGQRSTSAETFRTRHEREMV